MSDHLWSTIYHTPPHLHPFIAEVLRIFVWSFIGLLSSRVIFGLVENIVIWYAKFKGRWRWRCPTCEWYGVCSKAGERGYCDGRKKGNYILDTTKLTVYNGCVRYEKGPQP